jgi:ADP-ribose pyrophosphatase YjhB (NUDIX family)
VLGVGAVVLMDGRVVLVKRAHEPLKGEWSLPGGAVELGETLEEAITREILEETGLEVSVGPVIEVFDRITLDAEQHVEFHFVLVDYLCRPVGGTLAGGSDASEVTLADPAALDRYRLTRKTLDVIASGIALGVGNW